MHKFSIKGNIISDDSAWVYRLFGMSHTCPQLVADELAKAAGDDVEISLNSGGGSVFSGSEIRELLRAYDGKVTIKISGIAASAASVIATAADCEITPTGMIMIHNASSCASGDYRDMDQAAQMLVKVNTAIANAYIEKTGMSQKELFQLMDAETYMTAQEAVERGFVDRITQSKQAVANDNLEFINAVDMIDTEQMIENVLNIVTDIQDGNTDSIPQELQARLKMKQLQDTEASSTEGASVINKNEKEEMTVTLAELREQHPELGAQIDTMVNTAREEGVNAERSRMQGIDAVAQNIPADMVHAAKYDNPMNAGDLALEFLSKGKVAADNYMQAAKDDSKDSGAEGVQAVPSDKKDDETANLLNLMVGSANEGKEEEIHAKSGE